jgi:hypothetical protein
MKKRQISYGVYGMIEYVAVIRCGKSVFKVQFSDGVLSATGSKPATYRTSDYMMQHVIENSMQYKSGLIKKLRSTELDEEVQIYRNSPKGSTGAKERSFEQDSSARGSEEAEADGKAKERSFEQDSSARGSEEAEADGKAKERSFEQDSSARGNKSGEDVSYKSDKSDVSYKGADGEIEASEDTDGEIEASEDAEGANSGEDADGANLGAGAGVNSGSGDGANSGEGAEGGEQLTEVTVTCLTEAQVYLKENFGIASSKARTRATAQAYARQNGVKFVGLE